MRTHCGHSTQLYSLRDTRNAGCNVALSFSSVRAGLTGSCVCRTLLYGVAFWDCRCGRSLCSSLDSYSQNTSLTNSWLISMCFPGITFPGSDYVPQRLFINVHNQNHLRYPVRDYHERFGFDFVHRQCNSASLHYS